MLRASKCIGRGHIKWKITNKQAIDVYNIFNYDYIFKLLFENKYTDTHDSSRKLSQLVSANEIYLGIDTYTNSGCQIDCN